MYIEYTGTDYKGNDRQEEYSVPDFLYREILYTETWHGDTRKIPLEDQPKVVCEAIGRLIERLVEKGVFNLEDFKYVTKVDWGKKADTLKFKEE